MKAKKVLKNSLKSLKKNSPAKNGESAFSALSFDGDMGKTITSFIKDSFGQEAYAYGKKAVRWAKKNPTASTTLAVMSALAIGAMIKTALSDKHS